MNTRKMCMNCMQEKLNESGVCAACGTRESDIRRTNLHLPMRTILRGKYLLGRVIGEGGFGITYIGYDLDLEIPVAIKEFCPHDCVGRDAEDGLTLWPYDERKGTVFEAEKDKFIKEARRLARFRNEQGVVSVQDYFKENGTAYIVMEFIDGVTLKKYLKQLKEAGKLMGMAEVLALFQPVMETLAKIHKENFIHRDISPENIMFSKDMKKAYLIDFGTARNTEEGGTMSEYSKSFYTPVEQCTENMQQGPWTDIYALCATIYVCITGRVLPRSDARAMGEDIIAPHEYGAQISLSQEAVLLKGLALKPEERIRSMEELMAALYQEMPQEPQPAPQVKEECFDSPKEDEKETVSDSGKKDSGKKKRNGMIQSAIIIIILVIGFFYFGNKTYTEEFSDGGYEVTEVKNWHAVKVEEYSSTGTLLSQTDYSKNGSDYIQVKNYYDETGKVTMTEKRVNGDLVESVEILENGNSILGKYVSTDTYTFHETTPSGELVFSGAVQNGEPYLVILKNDYPAEDWRIEFEYVLGDGTDANYQENYYAPDGTLVLSIEVQNDVEVEHNIINRERYESVDWQQE